MEMYVIKQWSRRLLALLLTVCLVCTLAPAAFAEGEEEKAVEEKPCSIKVLSTSDAKLKEDLDKIEILVDVYQLATIDTTGGKYAYTLVDPFKSLELKPVETGKTEEEKEQMGLPLDKPVEIYKPCGCVACNNLGFKGRIGVYEILPMSRKFKNRVAAGAQAEELQELALKEGMHTLRMSATRLVLDGITTVSEMNRIARD